MGTPQRTINDRVEEVKALSGLGGYFELPVSSYSAGMRSRLVMSMIRLVRAASRSRSTKRGGWWGTTPAIPSFSMRMDARCSRIRSATR